MAIDIAVVFRCDGEVVALDGEYGECAEHVVGSPDDLLTPPRGWLTQMRKLGSRQVIEVFCPDHAKKLKRKSGK